MFAVFVFDHDIDRIESVILIKLKAKIIKLNRFPTKTMVKLCCTITKHRCSKNRAAIEISGVDDFDHHMLHVVA